MENADEDISAFLDPAPIASLATLIGQNLKDPILNKLRGASEFDYDDYDPVLQLGHQTIASSPFSEDEMIEYARSDAWGQNYGVTIAQGQIGGKYNLDYDDSATILAKSMADPTNPKYHDGIGSWDEDAYQNSILGKSGYRAPRDPKNPNKSATIGVIPEWELRDEEEMGNYWGESASSDWTHMTQEQRRTWLIENAIDIQDEDLHSVSGKDWNQLLPTIKYKLENSTEMAIEAETYRDLQV